MQYLIIVIVAAILLIIFLRQKPHKDENRIRNEEMIDRLNQNLEQYTDKAFEAVVSLIDMPAELDTSKLSDVDKRRIALAKSGKVLFSDASYMGSSYKLNQPKQQYECLRWVEKTLNENGVHGKYRISDSVNANDIGYTLDKEVFRGLHTLRWYFDKEELK